MLDLPRRARFVPEASRVFRVAGELSLHDLERDDRIVGVAHGSVDDTHRPFAKNRLQAVGPDAVAYLELGTVRVGAPQPFTRRRDQRSPGSAGLPHA